MVMVHMKNNPKTVPLALTAFAVLFLMFLSRQSKQTPSSRLTPSRQMQTSYAGSDLVPSYSLLSGLDEFFLSPFMTDSGLMPVMGAQHDMAMRSFSPLYQMTEDEKAVTVKVSVPDVRLQDIDIEIIEGKIMHISGSRRSEKDGSFSEVRFDKRFTLGRNMDESNIEATLKGGELTITTPKMGQLKEKSVRKVPIQEEL